MDDLEKRIDTNKRNGMEPKEVIDFLKNDKNVQELGKKLENSWNMNPLDRKNNQKFHDAVYNTTLNNPEFQNKIKEKIKTKKGLSDQEVFMLYLQRIIESNNTGGIQGMPLLIQKNGDIYTRYGGQALLNYIRTKYNNQNYEFWKGWPNALPTIGTKPKNNPGTIEAQRRTVSLPKNIDFGVFGESNTYSPREFSKLDEWAKASFSAEYEKEKQASKKRNSEKGDLMDDYVKFDLYNFAWQKYNQIVEEKHNGIVRKTYGNENIYKEQKELANQYFEDIDEINNQYPDINNITENLSEYINNLEATRKKYLKDTKEEVAQKKYEEYGEELNKKAEELGIKDIQETLSKDVENGKDATTFCENMNKLFEFQSEQETIKNKYGDIIGNYENYMTAKGDIVNKYGVTNLQGRISKYSKYNEAINNCKNKHKNFNVKKYESYVKELANADIEKHTENLNILQKCLNYTDSNSNFPIRSIKDNYQQQIREQEKWDRRWENLKNKSMFLYQLCHIGARGINALVSSTWGTGVKLGATISQLWHDDDEMVAVLERAGKWTPNIIGISSKQSESVYKDGEININWDNGPGVVAEGIVNMVTLIAGGGAIAKGIAKGGTALGINIGARGMDIIGKVGLFKSGFIQQIGNSFEEGFKHGMTGNQALVYGMLSAGIQGGLELVSPNEFILGSGSKLAKTYVKEILKTETEQSLIEIGKLFLKNVGSEIVEENIQEAIQLAAGNIINEWANNRYNLTGDNKLDADWNVNNFYATAIVTTLTTGVVAGGGFAMQTPGLLNQENRLKLIEGIKSNPKLQADVMNVLDNAITGKVKIQNIETQQLIILKENLNLETKNKIQEFINGKCESPIEGVDKIIPFEKLKNMLIESAQKNNLKDVAENIKNGNYEDPRIYGLPKYKELLEKGFILPSDIRPYYKSAKGLPEHHLGIDYQVKAGTEVKASYDGVVIKSHLDGGLGHKVIIEHTAENGKKFYSLYGHLGKDNLIPEGTPVTKGTVIGKVGESFTEDNGKWPSHLHFQIMENEDSPRGHASTEGVGNYNVLEAFGINYFNGKSHKFEVTDKQAIDNSQYMDKLINEINEGNKKEKFNELKNRINTLYGKDLNLTNEQLSSILDAHKQDGKLGELKMNELRNKNTILAETIKDKDVRRFLLEAGFCGKTEGIMENIELLKTNAEHLEELGIEVDPMNTDEINNMEIDLKKIEKLKNIGIKFNELFQYEIEEILKIEIDYEKLEYMINLGMEIKTDQIKELNDWEIDKETLLRMKNIGILNCFNREKINKSNIEVFEKLKNIGVEITYDDGNPLLNLIYQFKNLGLEDRDFQFIKENNLTNYTEIWFALSMKDNMNKETIKEYTKRKEIYLEKNRTITGKKYLELFGGSGKYGKTEINQKSIGLCYAYTGFEILKKTNSFDAIVQTNLKESSDGIGWEVRIPLCDKNGEWIKISKDEIDYKFERKNENGEISIVSINSESESIGFKILELAFIKKCIIDSIDWQDEWKCNKKGIDYNAIKKAQTEYKNTGKITYNDDLVKFVESGSTREFVKKMFNPKGNKYFIGGTQNPRLGVSEQAKDAAFENFNKGGILIEISIQHDNINDFTENNLNDECELIGEGEDYSVLVHDVKIIDKAQYNLECEYRLTSDGLEKIEENRKNNKIVPDLVIDENGKTICQIFKNHAYSIEKCYIDKNTGEKRVWVINPRHTGLKFDISLEEAKSIFSWNVFGTNIDAMFRDK